MTVHANEQVDAITAMIREQMELRGVTVHHLAMQTGTQRANIYRIMRGQTVMKTTTAVALASALGFEFTLASKEHVDDQSTTANG